MADIRCPMCSKTNSADAETCVSCGARLKPGRISGAMPGQPPAADPDAGSAPDWLSGLRWDEGRQPEDPAPELPAEPASPGSDLPDWLSRIRDRARIDTGEDPAAAQGGQEPDWMQGLQQGSAPETGETDWLERLQGNAAPEPAPAADGPAAVFPPAQSGEEDWMNQLSSWRDEAAQSPDAGTPPADRAPAEASGGGVEDDFAWLSQLNPGAGAESPAPAASADFNFSDFFAAPEQTPTGESLFPASGSEGDIQWAGPEEQPSADGALDGFGLTGFLSSIRDAETAAPAQPGDYSEEVFGASEAAGPLPEGDLPDWLRGPSAPGASPNSAPGDALPDWLAGQESQPPAPPASDATAPAEAPGETSVPDWLAAFSDETALPAGDGEAPDTPAFNAPRADADAPSSGPLEAGAETPAWMGNVFEPKFGLADEAPFSESPGEASALEDFLFAPSEGESLPVMDAGGDAAPDAGLGEEIPDWLRDFHDQPASGAGETVPPLIGEEDALETASVDADQAFNVELPDWLSEDAKEKTGESGEPPISAGNEDLEQADLPEWVKEMRPIESIIPGESRLPTEIDQRVEKAGPLAGIHGVLPAEELVARYRKPSVYSVKLRVTEKQRNQASLFDSLLAQESQPIQIPPARPQVSGALLRLLVAVVLLAALALPQIPWVAFAPLALPVLYPPEMLQMFDQLEQNATPDAPVLIAFDYQPGLAGEMRLSASPVIDQLMARNIPIVAISTVPTGQAMAQQLLAEVQSRHPAYDLGQKTVNLGYLPGGAISLVEFSLQPQTAATITLAGGLAWQETFLKDLKGLKDFSQVIVLTDSAETGRTWLEQVQPRLPTLPMYLVASAQAAPLLAPYIESGQAAGMTSGLLGGVMYARLAGQTGGAASASLAAYQVGMLLAMLVVLAGAVIYGGLSLLQREPKDEE